MIRLGVRNIGLIKSKILLTALNCKEVSQKTGGNLQTLWMIGGGCYSLFNAHTASFFEHIINPLLFNFAPVTNSDEGKLTRALFPPNKRDSKAVRREGGSARAALGKGVSVASIWRARDEG